MYKRFNFKNHMYEEKFMVDSFNQEVIKNKKEEKMIVMKTEPLDYYWKMYICVAFVYYMADCTYCAMHYDLSEDMCILAMFLHHVATIFMILPALSIPHYPWFLTLVFSVHTFLIAWPYNKTLHVPYAASLIHMLFRFFTRPFFQMKLIR